MIILIAELWRSEWSPSGAPFSKKPVNCFSHGIMASFIARGCLRRTCRKYANNNDNNDDDDDNNNQYWYTCAQHSGYTPPSS